MNFCRYTASCLLLAVAMAGLFSVATALASDHLDTPTVIKDPAADIGDLYAWMSPDGRRLNLVMDIVAHKFSDRLQYVFHIDSGSRFGATSASAVVVCSFDVANNIECWTDRADHVQGNADVETGIESEAHSFTVFAGLRDDPFFNNVKGTRAAYDVAKAALQHGTSVDGAGCPRFDASTSQAILGTWRRTGGGPASNFLAGWKTSALVVSIDVDTVARGGKLLAVWGSVHRIPHSGKSRRAGVPTLGEQIERTARPLIKNALVGSPLAPETISDRRKEAYNRVSRSGWPRFTRDIAATLGLYDSFDGECGNQWLANAHAAPAQRYKPLAALLADDRIWVNSASGVCTQFLAVEFNALHRSDALPNDCGGRTPNYDANNVFRSLLTLGRISGVDDGVLHDDKQHSTSTFPFLAKP
ncbi:DUF4331 domain-containing protein [Terriglobus albidus]|uniref:DUF4331 domain-containing protein n=1 Tax=Terriglobus albidus TaxID=1592106 RepID=UPI0021DF7B52|nr:DUF4331 domain-containing protein [Terriglobus albidus]